MLQNNQSKTFSRSTDIRTLERNISSNPTNALAHYELGCAHLEADSVTDAVRCFEKACLLNSGLVQAHFACGVAYTRMGSLEMAVAEWQKMLDSDGDFTVEGRTLAEGVSMSSAVALWRERMEEFTANGITHNYQLGVAFLALGIYDWAFKALEEAYLSNPDFENVSYYFGWLQLELGKNSQAAEILVKAANAHPRDARLQGMAGIAMHELGRNALALTLLRKAVELNPRYVKALLRSADIHYINSQYEVAIDLINKAIKANQKNAEAWLKLGKALEKVFRMDEALAAYQKAVELRAKFPEALLAQGMLYKQLGQQEQALKALQDYVWQMPSDAEGYYTVGTVFASLGRHIEAIDALSQCLSLNPKHGYAQYALSQSFLAQGMYSEAAQASTEALKLNPRDAQARASLAYSYLNGGDYKQAIAEYHEFLKLCPHDTKVHYFLGACWLGSERPDMAAQEYLEAAKCIENEQWVHLRRGAELSNAGQTAAAMEELRLASRPDPVSDEEMGRFSLGQLLAITTQDAVSQVHDLKSYSETLENSFVQIINAWSGLLDLRDKTSPLHSQRVSLIAEILATASAQGQTLVTAAQLGGLLHDVGKLSLPDSAWYVPREDGSDARFYYVQHAKLGSDYLSQVALPEGVLDCVLSHHERWDGQGFPNGLKGEEIPVAARIVALADVLERLLAQNSHFSPLQIMDWARREAGRRFDPAWVDVLDKSVDEILLQLAALNG